MEPGVSVTTSLYGTEQAPPTCLRVILAGSSSSDAYRTGRIRDGELLSVCWSTSCCSRCNGPLIKQPRLWLCQSFTPFLSRRLVDLAGSVQVHHEDADTHKEIGPGGYGQGGHTTTHNDSDVGERIIPGG